MQATYIPKPELNRNDEFVHLILKAGKVLDIPELAVLGEAKTIEQRVSYFYDVLEEVIDLSYSSILINLNSDLQPSYSLLENAIESAELAQNDMLSGETYSSNMNMSDSHAHLDDYLSEFEKINNKEINDKLYLINLKRHVTHSITENLHEGYNVPNTSKERLESIRNSFNKLKKGIKTFQRFS